MQMVEAENDICSWVRVSIRIEYYHFRLLIFNDFHVYWPTAPVYQFKEQRWGKNCER